MNPKQTTLQKKKRKAGFISRYPEFSDIRNRLRSNPPAVPDPGIQAEPVVTQKQGPAAKITSDLRRPYGLFFIFEPYTHLPSPTLLSHTETDPERSGCKIDIFETSMYKIQPPPGRDEVRTNYPTRKKRLSGLCGSSPGIRNPNDGFPARCITLSDISPTDVSLPNAPLARSDPDGNTIQAAINRIAENISRNGHG